MEQQSFFVNPQRLVKNQIILNPQPIQLKYFQITKLILTSKDHTLFQAYHSVSKMDYIISLSHNKPKEYYKKLNNFLQGIPLLIGISHNQTIIIRKKAYSLQTCKLLSPKFTAQLILDMIRCLRQLQVSQIHLDSLQQKDIYMYQGHWSIDLSGPLLRQSKQLRGIKYQQQNQFRILCLAFRVLFGSWPYNTSDFTNTKQFDFMEYFNNLDQKTEKGRLQIKNFLQGMVVVHDLIEWKKFFTTYLTPSNIPGSVQIILHEVINKLQMELNQNPYLKGVSLLEHKYQPKALIAIQQSKNFIQQQLPLKQQVQKFKILRNVQKRQSQVNLASSRIVHVQYFGSPDFDIKQDNPYRALQNFLEQNQAFGNKRSLLLHGYPYALAVELLQYCQRQDMPYHQKYLVKQTSQKLFLLSSINFNDQKLKCRPLGEYKDSLSYQQAKIQIRTIINIAYKHFMDNAFLRYKQAKPLQFIQSQKMKNQSLNKYRLSLKLLTASVCRKLQQPIDLRFLQMADKKQIEEQLKKLLLFFNNNSQ